MSTNPCIAWLLVWRNECLRCPGVGIEAWREVVAMAEQHMQTH